MSVWLSHENLARLSELATVLLSPLDQDSVDEWRDQSCRLLRTLVGGDQLYFLCAPLPGVDTMWTVDMPEPLRVAYAARFAEDEGTKRAVRAGVTACNQTSIVKGDWEGYRRDPIVNELFLPHGVHDTVCLVTEVEPEPRSGASWCRFHLGAARTPYGTELFGDSGLAMMRLLAPAFEAGVATLLAAGAWRMSLAGALDALATAAWVFTARGDATIHRNASAAHLIDDDPEAGRVEAAVAALARELARSATRAKSVAGADRPAPGTTTVRTAAASYALRGSYVAAARLAPGRTILVVARRTSPRPLDRATLRERYALTSRELQVAALIGEGLSAGDIARRLGVSIHTARRHVERLYAKLGVHSRAEAQRVLQDS